MRPKAHPEAATGFLRIAAQGEVQAAYDQFVGDHSRHRNPCFPGDRQSLLLAMQQSAEREPNKSFDVQRIVASGDLVVVHPASPAKMARKTPLSTAVGLSMQDSGIMGLG